jgi:Tfp pilus assembly PilM family ATPase
MTRALGIDLGSRTLKAVEIEFNSKTRRIVGLYESPFPEDGNLTNALQAFFVTHGLKGERVALGLGPIPVLLKRFQFPFGDKKRVNPAVQSEFEDQFPFDLSEHLLDVRAFGKKGRSHQFIAGLCPSLELEGLQAAIDKSGVSISSLTPDVEALGQLALHQQLPASLAPRPYAVCDLGFNTTKIAILQGSRPEGLQKKAPPAPVDGDILELRLIGRGSSEVVAWVQETQKIGFQDALNWLTHRAEIKPPADGEGEASLSDEISDEVKLALRPLVVDLYQTLQSFHSKHKADVGTLYLTGGISQLRGLSDFLSRELRCQVMAWNSFQGFKTELLPVSEDPSRRFAVALALAHRFIDPKPRGWLNFRRSNLAKKKLLSNFFQDLFQPQLRPVLAGLGIALAVSVSYGLLSAVLGSREGGNVQTELAAEFRRLNPELGKKAKNFVTDPVRARELFVKEQRTKLAQAKTDQEERHFRSRSEVLLDVSDAMPSSGVLKEIAVEERGDEELSIVFRIDMAKASAEAVARARRSIVDSLKSKNYFDPRVESDPSGTGLVASATRQKEAPEYE